MAILDKVIFEVAYTAGSRDFYAYIRKNSSGQSGNQEYEDAPIILENFYFFFIFF